MIIDILELAAVLEWLALGALMFFKLRSLNRRTDKIMREVEGVFTPTNYGRLSGKSQCRRTLSIWTLIAERMGGTSARALSGQKETREG